MAVPSIADYKEALRTALENAPEKHRVMLDAHYRAAKHTITAMKLAEAAGYENYSAANLQYGKFARRLCDLLSYRPPVGASGKPTPTYVLATGRRIGSSDFQWTLRPEVIKAIEELQTVDQRAQSQAQAPDTDLNARFATDTEVEERLQMGIAAAREMTPEARRMRLSTASPYPTTCVVSKTVFLRNPDVIVEVLERAAGKCEACGRNAPFVRSADATPYLEVHHIIPLAQNGEDSVRNALALCPNCHRAKHYG